MMKATSRAAMIEAKERAIVAAARENFLRDGFAVASMDQIARSAGVSVKTIYSHFENKSELFSTVMTAACGDDLLSGEIPSEGALAERFPWFADATRHGLMEAGKEYLRHLLSGEQLALYRVVTRDADRFPELGREYRKNIAHGRTAILVAYLRVTARVNGWSKRNSTGDARLYEALLRAGLYEEVLHGLLTPDLELIETHARSSSKTMWKLLASGSG
jgi:AcrR family transcriptional regulator